MATLFHMNAQGACVDTCTLTQLLMLWEDSLPGCFPFPRAFEPVTICCRCGGRLPGCFSPSPPTWRTLPPTPSLRSYFYRQPDHDFDDTEEAKRRRRELMKDLLTRMRLPDRAYFDKNLTPRQDIFWRAHSHPSFSSSPEWWPVLWS